MSISAYQRLTAFLVVLIVSLLLLCGWLFWRHVWLSIEVTFAQEQTAIFEEMCERALEQKDPVKVAGYLGYAIDYYP
jgi:hypothetical protein